MPSRHNVLVHPPGGLVGGDTLQVEVNLAEGNHGLLTTPWRVALLPQRR